MKKTFFTIALFLIFAATSFAGGSNKEAKLFKELSKVLTSANQTVYKTTDAFRSTSFMYNNKAVHAFYNNEDGELIGFSIPMVAGELPAGTLENIQKKYSGWQISEAMMFIDSNSDISYYVYATKDKKPTLVLKIYAKGKPCIYTRI